MRKNELRSGMFYSAMGRYTNVIIQLLVNAVLARILSPKDYGVVAIVQIFIEFFNLLADMGIGPAIIQSKNLDREEISVLFKTSLVFSVVLSFMFVMLGTPISIFYSNLEYKKIFIFLGFSVFFYSGLVVPRATLQKEKKFKRINQNIVYTGLVKGIISIIFALLGFRYYSLILGSLVQAMCDFILYTWQSKLSFRVPFRKEPLQKIWLFSRNQFSFNVVSYFSRNFDSILIGRVFKPSVLGYYNKAYQLSLYPSQILASVINPVLQPIMANYEKDIDTIKKTYFKIIKIMALVGFPLSIYCYYNGLNIVRFMFGNQWDNSVQTFKTLSLSIGIQMIVSPIGAFYQSSNRTDLLLRSGIFSMISSVSGIILGVVLGRIEYVAICISLSFLINFLINNYLLLYKVFKSSYLELLSVLIKPFIIAAMEIVVFIFIPVFQLSIIVNLAITAIIFMFVFIIGVYITGEWKLVKQLLKD